jgi:hypothetical protein
MRSLGAMEDAELFGHPDFGRGSDATCSSATDEPVAKVVQTGEPAFARLRRASARQAASGSRLPCRASDRRSRTSEADISSDRFKCGCGGGASPRQSLLAESGSRDGACLAEAAEPRRREISANGPSVHPARICVLSIDQIEKSSIVSAARSVLPRHLCTAFRSALSTSCEVRSTPRVTTSASQ